MFAKAALLAFAVLGSVPTFAANDFLPIPGPVRPRAPLTCWARNAAGNRFSASGLDAVVVQARAMAACRASSAVCVAEGCH